MSNTPAAFAYLLFALSAWTVSIKYAAPILTALARGEPWSTHVMWDAWPLAHLWLGLALLRRARGVVALALAVAATEVVVVMTKLALFLREPRLDPWTSNWLVNKVFVLGLFTSMLAWLSRRHARRALRERAP